MRSTIGVVTTSYPRFVGDSAGGFVAGHVDALRALGHRVEVIAAGEATEHETRIASDLFYRGGAPEMIEAAPLRGALSGLAFTGRMMAAIAPRHWDSMIAHWLAPAAIAALPSRIPLLAIAHGGDVHTLRRMHLLAPALYALRVRRARLVFVSEELRSIARAAAPGLARWLDHAIVQPMGIATDHFAALARTPSDPPTVVIAGRLVSVKGIDVAIEAMKHVRSHVRLVIAGDGPARTELERAARLAPIEFLGNVLTSERDRLLSRASAVLIPSRVLPNGRTEGLPTIALEALAAGVPVVASDLGGLGTIREIALVPPEDPRALAAALDRMLAAPPEPSRLRAAVQHLDWSRVASQLK